MLIKNKNCSIYNMEDNVCRAILLVIHFTASCKLREFISDIPVRLKTRTSMVLLERGLHEYQVKKKIKRQTKFPLKSIKKLYSIEQKRASLWPKQMINSNGYYSNVLSFSFC